MSSLPKRASGSRLPACSLLIGIGMFILLVTVACGKKEPPKAAPAPQEVTVTDRNPEDRPGDHRIRGPGRELPPGGDRGPGVRIPGKNPLPGRRSGEGRAGHVPDGPEALSGPGERLQGGSGKPEGPALDRQSQPGPDQTPGRTGCRQQERSGQRHRVRPVRRGVGL